MKIIRLAAMSPALLIVTTACGGGSDESHVLLYKPSGSLQCAATQTTQARLEAEVASLRSAGAVVSASHCANDGAAHAAVCGASNGDLFAVSVTPPSVAAARQLGFASAGGLPSVRTMACQ
ncbi:hypothetical protein [Piscinibacter sp.]|uniref:hypothetical protein n=1 Tax=Piscinibacter sp. TaxID=1903157 RepID=UPI0039E3C2D1